MMKTTTCALLLIVIAFPAVAQTARPKMMPRIPTTRADAAEMAVKQAAEDLARMKKRVETDIDVLADIRGADKALTDPMQPTIAVDKAYEDIEKAKMLGPEFLVEQGVIKAERELESARRSPTTADFGRLRAVIQEEALGPASRLVVREASALSDQTAAWIRIQQQISDHLRVLSDTVAEALKAADQ